MTITCRICENIKNADGDKHPIILFFSSVYDLLFRSNLFSIAAIISFIPLLLICDSIIIKLSIIFLATKYSYPAIMSDIILMLFS